MLGLLVLDTRFPRLPGDLGRADSWPVPVLRRTVAEAWPQRIVRPAEAAKDDAVLAAFVAAARELEAAGVGAITTSCGFLVLWQHALQAQVRVPVVTSSLLLLPALLQCEARVGVLTISAASLGAEHLRCAGVPADRIDHVLVQGVDPASHFATAILGNDDRLDAAQAADDVVAAALALRRRAPGLRSVVLECTNMPPHAARVAGATGWRVLSLRDAPALAALAALGPAAAVAPE